MLLNFLAAKFTITSRMKLQTELNKPTAVAKLYCAYCKPTLYT